MDGAGHRVPAFAALGAFVVGAALASGCLGPGTLNEEPPCAADGRAVVEEQCLPCHSVALEGTARSGSPEGLDFDEDADVAANAPEIREQLEAEAMPPTRPLSGCNQALLLDYLDTVEAGE